MQSYGLDHLLVFIKIKLSMNQNACIHIVNDSSTRKFYIYIRFHSQSNT